MIYDVKIAEQARLDLKLIYGYIANTLMEPVIAVTGSLFKQIEEVLSYLYVFNRVRGTFEGAYRVDHPDYPEIALREAFVNAIIHRDYYIEGSVLVSMFDDRLEITSLGDAMPGVTRDLMLAGVSVTRNEKLAQIFYRLKIIEAFGTGIPRIFSAYQNSNAKPEIPVVDGGFSAYERTWVAYSP